jgi:hypothetical protein
MALNGDRWITGWEFTPNDGAITSAEFRWRQSEPIGSWTPPERFVAFPEESGQLLPASATIEVTLTYRTSQQQHDFPIGIPSKPPQLGLMLLKTAPRFSVRNLSASCGETDVNIARGTLFAVRVTGATAGMPVGVTLAPMSARDVPGSATDPYSLMGAPLPVTWIREFDPGYQPTYRLALQLPGEFNAIIPSTPDRSQPCLVTYGLTVPRALASEPISPSTKTAR